MPKPTLAEFRAYEYNWEPAVQTLLKSGGQPVWSPFIVPGENGQVDLEAVPDDVCFVSYEPDDTGDEILIFRDSARYEGGQVPDAADFRGTLIVTRRVPMGDRPRQAGEPPGCYQRLCQEAGKIRALLLDTERPFADLLPWYDVRSITEAHPNRQLDGPRSANQITLRFPVKFLPADGAW